MFAAQRHIAIVAADLGLRALPDSRASGIDPQVHRRLAAAVTHSLQFHERVRNAQQHLGAREQFALEIGAQAIAQHRNVRLVRKPGELPDLSFGEELRLVDQHAGQRFDPGGGGDPRPQVGFGVKAVRLGMQANAAFDRAGPAPVIQRGGPQHGRHAALAVVEIGLQQRGRFARVHAGVVEVKLGHAGVR